MNDDEKSALLIQLRTELITEIEALKKATAAHKAIRAIHKKLEGEK